MLDVPATAAGLVTREIRSGARNGQPTKIAVARRTYPTERADLWDAVTNAERIPRWFLPATGELEVGGRYQLEGNAGGVIEHCERPDSFSVTWEYGPMVSWLRVTLSPADAGTTLELEHEAPVDPALWAQFGPGAVGVGWDLGLLGLGLHLDGGGAVDPADAAAFPTTSEGVAFVEAAAEGWSRAAIDDGDDPEAARSAAENTVEMYTADPAQDEEG